MAISMTLFSRQDISNRAKEFISKIENFDIPYEYPDGLDFTPDSDMHGKLVTEILARAQRSRNMMTQRFPFWEEIDRTLTAFIQLDTEENALKDVDHRRPIRVTIPETYATLESYLTYFSAAFLDTPIFRYDWVGPEDMQGTILLEMLIEQQMRRYKSALNMYTMWRNAVAYNVGPAAVGYVKDSITVDREEQFSEPFFSEALGQHIPGIPMSRTVRSEKVISEGNEIIPIDPYYYLPDPNTPVHDTQSSEYVGWLDPDNLLNLLYEEDAGNGLFNVQYLRGLEGRSSLTLDNPRPRQDKYGRGVPTSLARTSTSSGDAESSFKGISNPVDVIYMAWDLIPSEFNLGNSEYPERWFFGVAGDGIIIQAGKIEEVHGRKPVVCASPDFDGHSTISTSKLEVINGLQTTADWMFDSHIANVRKAINDMIVVDPQMINLNDLRKPGPGKIIRLRRSAWGRSVGDAIKQLDIRDVTANHMNDVGSVQNMIRDLGGAGDVVQGIRRKTSERVSATEANQTTQAALSRLQRAAQVVSLQAHDDMAMMMASNTGQFMSEETFVKVIGDRAQELGDIFGEAITNGRALVTPEALDVMFDVTPHDGSVPASGDVSTWMEMFQIISNSPFLQGAFDMPRIFKHIARLSGAKNINDFILKGGTVRPEIVPDEQVLAGQRNGDTVPLEELANV